MEVEIRGEVGSHSDDITVLALQRRARQNYAVIALIKSLNRGFAQSSEPIPPVGIGERDTGAHLLDIGRWVKLFGLSVGITQQKEVYHCIPRHPRYRANAMIPLGILPLCSCRIQQVR